jgi:hypothetical protein
VITMGVSKVLGMACSGWRDFALAVLLQDSLLKTC